MRRRSRCPSRKRKRRPGRHQDRRLRRLRARFATQIKDPSMVLLRQCPRRRPGWSIIDLAVLLFILFVAAGLIVPFVMRQQKNSQRAHCSYNLKQLGNAIHLFDEKNGFLPPARIADDYATWAVLIVPYLE